MTAGSFFDPLPAGADAYLLVDILHDWDDEHAHRILARCAEAAHPTGRVLVIGTLADAHGLTLDTVTTLTDQRCLLEFVLTASR